MTDLRRFTATAGLVLAGMMILGFALDVAIISTTGGAPMVGLDTLAADLGRVRGSAIWPTEAWVYTLQIVPFALFVLGLRATLRTAGAELAADVATLAAVLFMGFHTLHNLAFIAVIQGLAPVYVQGAPNAPAIEATARGFVTFADATFLPGGGVGGLLFVTMMAAFVVAQRRTRALAAGSGRIAAASAVLLAIGYAQYIVPAALFVALIGWLAFIAWTAVVSIGCLQAAERRSTALAAQPS